MVDGRFDPSQHISYDRPPRTYTMSELGLPADLGVSPIAVSEPFQLFSEEAVDKMRSEILQDDVLQNYLYTNAVSPFQLRGYASRCAPFVRAAWNSPEIHSIVSRIAGIDLIPALDYDVGHVDFSLPSSRVRHVAHPGRASHSAGVAIDWHTDAYPFACILMLSDTRVTKGGETVLRTGSGELLKIRAPRKGCAIVLQGRYLTHQSLRALSLEYGHHGGESVPLVSERITMMTSFRPKSALVRDDTALAPIRAVSDRDELFHQYAMYRLEMLTQRCEAQKRRIQALTVTEGRFDVATMRDWLYEQDEFLRRMRREIVVEEEDGEKAWVLVEDDESAC